MAGDVGAAFRAEYLTSAGGSIDSEILPVELARAAAAVLNVDGAGISVIDDQFRVPLGASDEQAGLAERLQFTAGEGPCLDAVRNNQPASATASQIASRWPAFAGQMFERTAYRAVIALPIGDVGDRLGAMDLYLTDAVRLPTIDVAGAIEVTKEIAHALVGPDSMTVVSALTGLSLPRWLHGAPARTRLSVWLAVGELMAALDLGQPDALDVLRAHAYAAGSTADEIAEQLIDGTLSTADFSI